MLQAYWKGIQIEEGVPGETDLSSEQQGQGCQAAGLLEGVQTEEGVPGVTDLSSEQQGQGCQAAGLLKGVQTEEGVPGELAFLRKQAVVAVKVGTIM